MYKDWVKLGKKMNSDGTGVRIEAVNGSYTKDKATIGVDKYP